MRTLIGFKVGINNDLFNSNHLFAAADLLQVVDLWPDLVDEILAIR